LLPQFPHSVFIHGTPFSYFLFLNLQTPELRKGIYDLQPSDIGWDLTATPENTPVEPPKQIGTSPFLALYLCKKNRPPPKTIRKTPSTIHYLIWDSSTILHWRPPKSSSHMQTWRQSSNGASHLRISPNTKILKIPILQDFLTIRLPPNNQVIFPECFPKKLEPVAQTPLKKPRSMLIELQRLFANMQKSEQSAVSTESLTKSFGWKGNQVFEQHDVHELNR
jgi:hypothetical protein